MNLLEIEIKSGLSKLEQDLLKISKTLNEKAANTALSRTVARSRLDMREAMPRIFDRPTPFTVNAIRYSVDPAGRSAALYISEDAPKGTPPARYLRAEIMGGARRDKRSERALVIRGLLAPDQQTVPGEGAPLDQYGNLQRGLLTRVLSRLGAFGEQGYAANASAKTKKRLRRQKLAAASTGTDFFVGKNKDGRPGAVYRVLGNHSIVPVLIFTDRRAHYRARFDFAELASKSFAATWPKEMRRAFHEAMENLGLRSK